MKLVREYLAFQGEALDVRKKASTAAIHFAHTKIRFVDILNAVIETLIREKYELPALSTLEKVTRTAMVMEQNKLYSSIAEKMTPELQAQIDSLLDC